MKCRICHCTPDDACQGGCAWIQPDLCSTCAAMLEELYAFWFAAGPSGGREGAKADVGQIFDRLIAEAKVTLADSHPPEPLIVVASA